MLFIKLLAIWLLIFLLCNHTVKSVKELIPLVKNVRKHVAYTWWAYLPIFMFIGFYTAITVTAFVILGDSLIALW
jgi:hypothetical protein